MLDVLHKLSLSTLTQKTKKKFRYTFKTLGFRGEELESKKIREGGWQTAFRDSPATVSGDGEHMMRQSALITSLIITHFHLTIQVTG